MREKKALCWLIAKHPGEIIAVGNREIAELLPDRIVHFFESLRCADLAAKQKGTRIFFLDSDPSYSKVKAETEKAIHFLKNTGNGLVIWHDYYLLSPPPLAVRTTDYLHEEIAPYFSDLTAISMTRLAYLFYKIH